MEEDENLLTKKQPTAVIAGSNHLRNKYVLALIVDLSWLDNH